MEVGCWDSVGRFWVGWGEVSDIPIETFLVLFACTNFFICFMDKPVGEKSWMGGVLGDGRRL